MYTEIPGQTGQLTVDHEITLALTDNPFVLLADVRHWIIDSGYTPRSSREEAFGVGTQVSIYSDFK
jgi:hypothetical protein